MCLVCAQCGVGGGGGKEKWPGAKCSVLSKQHVQSPQGKTAEDTLGTESNWRDHGWREVLGMERCSEN